MLSINSRFTLSIALLMSQSSVTGIGVEGYKPYTSSGQNNNVNVGIESLYNIALPKRKVLDTPENRLALGV